MSLSLTILLCAEYKPKVYQSKRRISKKEMCGPNRDSNAGPLADEFYPTFVGVS